MFGWDTIVNLAAAKVLDQAVGYFTDNIRQIDHKLNLLIFKDFNTGLDYFDESRRAAGDTARAANCIREAMRYFRQSFGIGDPWVQTISGFAISVCCLLLGDREEFHIRAGQCMAACDEAMDELAAGTFTGWGLGIVIPKAFELEFGTAECEALKERAKRRVQKAGWLRKIDFNVTLFWNWQIADYPSAKAILKDRPYAVFKAKYFACRDINSALTVARTHLPANVTLRGVRDQSGELE